jgi:hypothetical protein
MPLSAKLVTFTSHCWVDGGYIELVNGGTNFYLGGMTLLSVYACVLQRICILNYLYDYASI